MRQNSASGRRSEAARFVRYRRHRAGPRQNQRLRVPHRRRHEHLAHRTHRRLPSRFGLEPTGPPLRRPHRNQILLRRDQLLPRRLRRNRLRLFSGTNFPYEGVTTEPYEYQRYQTGAVPLWTPLRFKGQYFDAETDLFENWNRYYAPNVGRYLAAEPLFLDPRLIDPSIGRSEAPRDMML